MAKAFAIVGATGTGKTTLVKQEFVSKLHNSNQLVVYDIGGEYGKETTEDFEDWVIGLEDHENVLIVLEEATMNMDARKDWKPIRKALIRKRHNNVVIVFVFHSLARVPNSIIYLIDGWFLFPTLDNPKAVKDKFSEQPYIFEAYQETRHLNKLTAIYIEQPNLYER